MFMERPISEYWRERPTRGLRYWSVLEEVDGGFQVSTKCLLLSLGEGRGGD